MSTPIIVDRQGKVLIDQNGTVVGTSTNPLYVADRLKTSADHMSVFNPLVIWGPGGAVGVQSISVSANTSASGVQIGQPFDTSQIARLYVNVDSAVIPVGTLDVFVDRYTPSGVPIQLAHLTQLTTTILAIAWSIGPGMVSNQGLGTQCRLRYVTAGQTSGTITANFTLSGD